MTREMDSRVELEPQVPEVFVGEGIKALGQEMAEYSLTPLGQGKYLLRPESTDEEVAEVLSKVGVKDPNLKNLNPSERPVEAAALTYAIASRVKESFKDSGIKRRLDEFGANIVNKVGEAMAGKTGRKVLAGTITLGLLATACGSASAAPQGRPLPPETPATAVPTPIEPTKVPTPRPTERPTPVPEVKAVVVPAELKNAGREAIAGWMAEGGTQLALLSRGENLTGKLYYINGGNGIKEAPTHPLMIYRPRGENYNIKMNKETGEINAFYTDVKKAKFIPVKLDQTTGDRWVDAKTNEFVWGNLLGTRPLPSEAGFLGSLAEDEYPSYNPALIESVFAPGAVIPFILLASPDANVDWGRIHDYEWIQWVKVTGVFPISNEKEFLFTYESFDKGSNQKIVREEKLVAKNGLESKLFRLQKPPPVDELPQVGPANLWKGAVSRLYRDRASSEVLGGIIIQADYIRGRTDYVRGK